MMQPSHLLRSSPPLSPHGLNSSLSTSQGSSHSQLRLRLRLRLRHPTLLQQQQRFPPAAAASKPHNNQYYPEEPKEEEAKEEEPREEEAKEEEAKAEDDEAPHANDPAVRVALSLLHFYKREISPLLPRSCRYVPTCSEYSMLAFQKYGLAKGSILTASRICRCNPFGGYGFDPPRWFGEEREEQEPSPPPSDL